MRNKILLLEKEYGLSLISIFAFFVLWEIAAKSKIIDPLFISSPSRILAVGYDLIKTGEIFPHLIASLETYLLGFLSAVFAGVLLGLAIGFYGKLYESFKIYIFVLSSLPMVAMVPLIIIWFGIGVFSKAMIVFLMAIIPILIGTIDGVKNTDKELLRMARSFGASPLFVLRTITFFDILPFVFSSLRIAIGRGVIGLVIGETFGYGKGLGFLVSYYGTTFQTSRLMFVILVLSAISLTATNLVGKLEEKIIKWRE